MTWCPTTSQRGREGRGRASSWCSPSWRRQCCPADRRCTEQPRLGWRLGASGALFSIYVSVEEWGRKDYENEFSRWDWNDMVANVEDEHTKGTDQGADLSFLLDELRSLHRPCLSVSPWLLLLFFVLIGVCGNWQPMSPFSLKLDQRPVFKKLYDISAKCFPHGKHLGL